MVGTIDKPRPESATKPQLNRLAPDALTAVTAEYDTLGAAVARNVVPQDWLQHLAKGTERLLVNRSMTRNFDSSGRGQFVGSVFSYLHIPEYRDFIMDSGVGRLAAEIMRSKTARFFYDQPLIKEPGSVKRTPWHHDSAYWPCTGRQVMSVWVPLDPATPETGVVSYVKGSHNWGAYHPPENWSDDPDHGNFNPPAEDPGPGASRNQPRTLLDIHQHPEHYEFTNWSLEPGDVLIHQMETVHGAPGNSSQNTRRRAIAFRFFGDDARWDETHPHFMLGFKDDPAFPYPKHQNGELITDPLFPVLWSQDAA